MDPVTIIAGLTQIVPWLAGVIAGDKAEEKAEKVLNMAKAVTGIEYGDLAVKDINHNPESKAKFLEAITVWRLEMAREDTARLVEVNQTMRDEGKSEYAFRRNWRPFWGYVTGTAFGLQIFGLMFCGAWAVIKHPEQSGLIIGQLATLASALMSTWAIAMAVLGVSVLKRSEDKQVAAGMKPTGIINGLKQSLTTKGE